MCKNDDKNVWWNVEMGPGVSAEMRAARSHSTRHSDFGFTLSASPTIFGFVMSSKERTVSASVL